MIEQIEELNGQINVSGNIVGTIIGQNCSGGGGSGGGDMYKAVYDTNDNGIVDNAEKVNNHTVLSDVPANAVFTDTTYTAGTGIDITGGVISNTQTSAEWGNISGNLSDQTDLKTALDSKANSSSIPTKISDLTNDSEFKSVAIGDDHSLATEDIYIEKQYNNFTDNVVVSDNLNGVTLDLGFPEMGETPIMFEDPYTSSYNYNTEYPIIESSKYAITFWHGNATGFGYIEVIQVKNKDLNQTIAELYWASETTIETTSQSYTLPSDFGTVTDIDNVIGVYPYIKKNVSLYDYSDVYFKENNSYKKINNKGVEIPISNIAPSNPSEDDLWIDTSEPEEMQETIKNEYSESTTDTYSCDYVNTYVQEMIQGTVLWTNSNPSNTFGNQTVQFNVTDYDKFEVICRLSTSNDIRICQTVYKGSEYRLMEVGYETNDNAFIRSVNINSSGAYFSDCSGYGVGSNTQFTPINNNALIPLEIKGFKAYIS